MTSTINLIRQIFEEHELATLDELYEILSNNPKFTLSKTVIRHRIRSSIFALKKNGEITRIKNSTYKKIQLKK